MQAEVDTNKMVYKAIGDLHQRLTEGDRKELVAKLKHLLVLYEIDILSNPMARKVIYRIFEQRKNQGKVAATMSRAFTKTNAVATGTLNREVISAIYTAFDADYNGNGCAAAAALHGIGLHLNVLNDPGLTEYSAHKYAMITEIRERLFRSVVKMCASIAKRIHSSIRGDNFGEVIEEADLHQEAILAAKQSVDLFRPEADTYTVYMYHCVVGILTDFVRMRNRTVVIPKRKINRLGPLIKAMSSLSSSTYDELAEKSTSIFRNRVLQNRGRKLRAKEVYTADEVEHLLKMNQAEVSLDVSVASDDGVITTLGQQIASPDMGPEQYVEKYRAFGKILSVIRGYCTSEEFEFMKARWTSDGPVSLKAAATTYRKRTGKAMHKAQASEIEARVFTRIREGIANGDDRLTEIQTALDNLS